MANVAVHIEGGLISGDLLERIVTTPESVEGQRPGDFGVEGRLSEEIQSAFSEAGTHWKAFEARLHRGKESATTITRETWMLPLLQELGYDPRFQRGALQAGGSAYPISHCFGADENKSPIHIVASGQQLDKRGDASLSPHAMVQDYLNRSDSIWGFVTNGRRLRLLRNTARFSRPSYIEFDLEAMMAGGLYSEFVLFYRLVHASRLPRSVGDAHECLLERYHQQGIEEGGRVREKLRDGVREALEILGTGLLAHPDSTTLREKFTATRIDDLGYYRQLLRLIYRLLFLMVAEERRLLFVPSRGEATRQEIYTRWYSIARLRERAEARLFDDGESDLWEGLKQTFRLFEEPNSASELGLTALDGELFGHLACVDLIDTTDGPGPRLRNDKLLSAIWRLSTFEDSDGRRGRHGPRRRVNFAGLDVEELGSVYEALLDYHPRVTIEGERSRFELVSGSERKSTGSYYTPPELVRELIKSALEPVVADRLSKVSTREDKERALLSLKVCDPASGSGHFVLAAARRIGRELARVRSGEAEPNPEDYRRAVRDVIRRCIYAVDKNPLAVDLCKVALWIEGHESSLPLSFLDNHVKNGDSLVGVLDLSVLEAGVPDGAYAAVTGDDKKVAATVKKANKTETSHASLFHHTIKGDIGHIAGAFTAVADLPETTPDEVHAKEQRYADLRRSRDWERAKVACDLWTAAFFARLTADGKAAVPTTRNIWDAISGHLPRGSVAALTTALADEQRFFHWPLEFPEVLAQGGFDVILGNPPWEKLTVFEREFFSGHPNIANENRATVRKRLIASLSDTNPMLFQAWQKQLHAASAESKFIQASANFPTSAQGDINLYALFSELAYRLTIVGGFSGQIVKTNLLSAPTWQRYTERLLTDRSLVSVYDFRNRSRWFPEIGYHERFTLLTISPRAGLSNIAMAFYLDNTEQIDDIKKSYTITVDDIIKLNPLTQTLPTFNTPVDKEVMLRIATNFPILFSTQSGWAVSYTRGLDMTVDDDLMYDLETLENEGFVLDVFMRFVKGSECFVPLTEGKLFHQFDHRFASFEGIPRDKRFGVKAPTHSVEAFQKTMRSYEILPRYWVKSDVNDEDRRQRKLPNDWAFCFRHTTNVVSNYRTSVATIVGPFAFSYQAPNISFSGSYPAQDAALLCALMNSFAFDYVTRQKFYGANLTKSILGQVQVPRCVDFAPFREKIITSVGELVWTSAILDNFIRSLGLPIKEREWNETTRASIRAEIDAVVFYLYGMNRREIEYVLSTFTILRDREEATVKEFATKKLILETWDRFVSEGTFDLAKLRDPEYVGRIADELLRTRAKLEETEQSQRALLALASKTPKPTLFVEGVTDVAIVEAAWSVFFPSEPIPVKVLAAGGTKEMGSLAGPGKALREVLGDKIVLALADNDAAGRRLIEKLGEGGQIKSGGRFKQLLNGIHWCLLKPTEGFTAAMKAHSIPNTYWPFTIEAAFSPSLRQAAEAAGAWEFSGQLQAEIFDNPDLARRLVALLPKLGPGDDAYWYLMAPAWEAKEPFAAWVTRPEQRTEMNYAAFEEIIRGLRDLLLGRNTGESRAA